MAQKDGKIVIGGKLLKELNKVRVAAHFIKTLSQAGRAVIVPSLLLNKEILDIDSQCKSNDCHIIALARISGARILCSLDKTLHKDFRNLRLVFNPKGHIYQKARHSKLLKLYGHTDACRRKII
mgnify:FL=1